MDTLWEPTVAGKEKPDQQSQWEIILQVVEETKKMGDYGH